MPKTDYSLLFEDGVYEDMARDHYNSSRWMSMQPVPMEAVKIHRSDKKFVELCRRVLLIGDVLTMRKAGRDGIVINFSATIKAFDSYSSPIMETIGQANIVKWSCEGPTQFDEMMVRFHPGLASSSRKTWDTIYVTRNGQELGNLYLLRQCLQLWEDEMEKWGCNGLGEELGDK